MATVVHELKDCVVTDSGEVIVKYKHFVIYRLLAGKSIEGLKVERQSFAERVVQEAFSHISDLPQSDVEYHNDHCTPDKMIEIGQIDGNSEGPPMLTFEFDLPDPYRDFDLLEYVAERLAKKFSGPIPQEYVDRLSLEWELIQQRAMEDFVRSLVYMVETWESAKVVHGVGRGSACASLILYLIGVHMVDPVEYEIPISEFLR